MAVLRLYLRSPAAIIGLLLLLAILAMAASAGWRSGEKGDGTRGRGIGFARYKNGAIYVAEIAEVEIGEVVQELDVSGGKPIDERELGRLVRNQRSVIGMLAANGFPRRRLLVHYLAYGALVGAGGSAVGAVGGAVLARWLTHTYTSSLGIPLTITRFHLPTALIGIAVGTAAGLLATIGPARAALHVTPAEAMQGTAPTGVGHRALAEHLVAGPADQQEKRDDQQFRQHSRRDSAAGRQQRDHLRAADVRPLCRGQRRAVESEPGKQDRCDLVVPHQRSAKGAEQDANRHLDGEHRHQRDDDPLQQALIAPAQDGQRHGEPTCRGRWRGR